MLFFPEGFDCEGTEQMLHYLFVDEAYQSASAFRRIVMSGWLVEETAFQSRFDSQKDLYRTPVLESINLVLEQVDGLALIATATLDLNVARPGERDSTDDITGMSRTDNIWSQCLIFTVAMLIKEMMRAKRDVSLIDLFHDPKSLKMDHSDAITRTLRGFVVDLAKQFTYERNIGLFRKLEIRNIVPVAKGEGDSRDCFQKAIWIADRLCRFALADSSAQGTQRIIRVDMTDLIANTVRQFDGIPFYEGSS